MQNLNKNLLFLSLFISNVFNLFGGSGFSKPSIETYKERLQNSIKPLSLKIEKILQENHKGNSFYVTVLINYFGKEKAKKFLNTGKIKTKSNIKQKHIGEVINKTYAEFLTGQIKEIDEFKFIFGQGEDVNSIITTILENQAKLFRKNEAANLKTLENSIIKLMLEKLNQTFYESF